MESADIAQIIISIVGTIVPLATLFMSTKNHTKIKKTHKEQLEKTTTVYNGVEVITGRLDNLESKMDAMEEEIFNNNLQTARVDFRQALHHSPDNIPAILEIARIYFLIYKGNADMGRKFLAWVSEYRVEDWAKEHHEDISNLIEAASHSV